MKKILVLILSLVLAFLLLSCDGENDIPAETTEAKTEEASKTPETEKRSEFEGMKVTFKDEDGVTVSLSVKDKVDITKFKIVALKSVAAAFSFIS